MYLGVDYYPEHWDKNMINEESAELFDLPVICETEEK